MACLVPVVVFILLPWSLQQKLFAVPYGIDPQRPSHTYVLGGQQMPLEARKTGMFGGFLLVYLALLAAGRTRAAAFPPRRILAVLLGFVAVMAIDGLNATFFDLGWPHLYAPDLRLRLATGLLMGLTMAALLLPAINGSLWRDISDVPSLSGIKDVAALLFLCGAFFLLVDARPAILYYAISILAVAGLICELAVINLVFLLIVARRVGTAGTATDVLLLMAPALGLAACELALMSIVRYATIGSLTSTM